MIINRKLIFNPILKAEEKYRKACDNYIKLFCEKHNIEFDYWVQDMPGTVAFFGDYSFSFTDIVWDINSRQPNEKIFEWFDFYVSNSEVINYYSYTKL